MTSPIGVGSTPLVQNTPGGTLDKEDFLQLLVTQLRHQDPLNPMDGTAFASQLAEFSGLEQLIQVNEGLASQSQGDVLTQLSLRTTLAATLIGHEVMGFGGQINVTGSGEHQVTVDVGGPGVATIDVIDKFGNTIATRAIGPIEGGSQQNLKFHLEGVPPGNYGYQVTVTNQDGTLVPVDQFTVGKVEGVFFNGGGVSLRLENGLLISLDNLAEIEPAKE